MVAVMVITTVSLSIQKKYAIEVKKDWKEPVNLYSLVVAKPSERKSPTLKEVTAPIYKYVIEENERRKQDIAEYELQKNILVKRIENMKKALSDPKKGKEVYTMKDILEVQKELDDLEEVHALKMILDDVTPEALIKAMAENDERIALVSAEGGIFGTMAGRYSDNTNIDIFLKGYSGESYSSARISRNVGDLDNPLITMLLAVQPSVIEDIMENKEFRGRGLLARFLYTIPNSIVGKRVYRSTPIDDEVRNEYESLIKELLDIPDIVGERMIHLSDGADKLAEEYFLWIESQLTNELEEIEDWAGKMHGNTMRIASIFHVIKHKLNSVNVPLEESTMKDAIEVGKYFLEHTKAVFDIMGLSDPQEVKDAKYILRRLNTIYDNLENDKTDKKDNKIKSISKRDLLRLCQRFHKMEEMEAGLQCLVEHGYISIETIKTGGKGRPSEIIYINPEYEKERKTNE